MSQKLWTLCHERFGPYRIYWDLEEHVLNFAVCDDSDDFDADQEDFTVSGLLKWDGCMNWTTGDDCMAHFCEPAHAADFGKAMAHIWTLGILIPKHDPDCFRRKEVA